MRAQSECLCFALSGVGNDKKFRSSLFKGLRGPRFASEPDSFPEENCAGTVCLQTVWFPLGTMSPWSLHRNGAKSLIPKTSSARGSKMPAGILRRGRIARASPMDEVGSMPTSSIKNERAYHFWFTQSVELRGPARPAYAGVKSFAKAKR